MNVLFVYPSFPDTYWSFRNALGFVGKNAAFPPLGLMTVSSMLPADWGRRLVDLNVRPLQNETIAWADIVFVSAMIVQKDSLAEVVHRCRDFGKPVAVGGPYVSTSADKVPEADFLFIGEAETTVPEFVEDLRAGTPKRVYRSAERPSLLLSPIPDYRLIDFQDYSAMNVQYSRGCPFQCEFCDIIEIYGRVPRTKSSRQMIAELDALMEAGWRGLVFIVDDNFIGNKKNVREFLPDLAQWSRQNGFPFSFLTEASVNLSDDEPLLELMRESGFRRVFIGIETPVEETLKDTQKGQNTRRDLLESIHRIQSYGIEVMAGFIVGFDNDPEDIFDRQIEFINESAIPLAMVGLLNALPETQLWRRLEKEERLLRESTGDNTDCSLNFVPKMDPAKLVGGYRRILKAIYSPENYYRRSLECLERSPAETPEPRLVDTLGDIRALFRIIVALAVRNTGRLEFIKYMFRVFWRFPHAIVRGLMLAAFGYHFRIVSAIAGATPGRGAAGR